MRGSAPFLAHSLSLPLFPSPELPSHSLPTASPLLTTHRSRERRKSRRSNGECMQQSTPAPRLPNLLGFLPLYLEALHSASLHTNGERERDRGGEGGGGREGGGEGGGRGAVRPPARCPPRPS
eukprot:scaffold181388_cov28-Tisochrysis_lutea.AAC.6